MRKGAILIIEVGREEVKTNTISLINRLTSQRVIIPKAKIGKHLKNLIGQVEREYWKRAKRRLSSLVIKTASLPILKKKTSEDFLVETPVCKNLNCLQTVEKSVKAEIIGSLYGSRPEDGARCIICQKRARQNILLGRKWKGEK